MTARQLEEIKGVGLEFWLLHYNSEINREVYDYGWRRELGLFKDLEKGIEQSNERLYKLFAYKKNILEIMQKKEDCNG